MMVFIKQASLRRVFSYLAKGCFWPEAAIGGAENYAYRIAALWGKAEVHHLLLSTAAVDP